MCIFCAQPRARPLSPHNTTPASPTQCFDITDLSEARAGAHNPLAATPQELPRWSKAMTQFK
jgi:hypothetical protein